MNIVIQVVTDVTQGPVRVDQDTLPEVLRAQVLKHGLDLGAFQWVDGDITSTRTSRIISGVFRSKSPDWL